MPENFFYPDAGHNAPPGVRAEIDRFRSLPLKERAKLPLLYWLLGSGTPVVKMAQDDVAYTDKSQVYGQTCGNCRHMYYYLKGSFHICDFVRGKVELPGWCNRWEA